MEFSFIALQMVTVALPIILGWVAGRLDFMGGDFDVKLSRLVLYVTLPCMTLASLGSAGGLPSTSDMVWMAVAVTVMMLVACAVAFIMTWALHPPQGTEGVYRFITMFGNCAFIGFPVISAVLGKEALLFAAIGIIPANVFMFTVGLLLISGEVGGLKKTLAGVAACFKTPMLISSLAVVVLVVLGVDNLGIVGDALDIVGGMTTPAALLLQGSSLSRCKPLSMLTNWRAYIAVAGRLLVVPLAGFAVLKLLGVPSAVLVCAVLETSMPVATNGTLYCLQFGVDPQPMTQGTFISIVASIVTIPLVVLLCAV